MISKIRFKNFKIFKAWQELEIKPITILMGKNNTGKSAILKMMPMLESCLSNKLDVPIQMSADDIRFANFPKELIYGKSNKGLEFDIYENTHRNLKIKLFVEDQSFKIESWNWNNELSLFLEDDFYTDNTPTFRGFRLASLTNDNNEALAVPNNQFTNKDIFTDYISGIREEAKPNYPVEGKIPEKSGVKGENLYPFLIEDSQTTAKKYFSKISNWIRDKFEGWELKIEYDGYRKDLPARIFLKKGSLEINFSQTGTGISQVLPLLIRAYKPCDKETLIILEEPESHLHPYAHAQIAQLFFESLALDKNKRYLIETHSQNFILRMRRLVAEGKLSPNHLKIYYVDYNEDSNFSSLKEIKVDSGGGVDKWPQGVFGESVLEARAIVSSFGKIHSDIDVIKLVKSSVPNFIDNSKKTIFNIEKAVQFLFESVFVINQKALPSSTQLSYITEFFNIIKEPTPQQLADLRKWFWITSYSNYFMLYNALSKQRKIFHQFRSYFLKTESILIYNETPNLKFYSPKYKYTTFSSARFCTNILFQLSQTKDSILPNNCLGFESIKLIGNEEYSLGNMVHKPIIVNDALLNYQGKKQVDLSFILTKEFQGQYGELFITDEMRNLYAANRNKEIIEMREKLICQKEKAFVESLGIEYE